MTNLSKNNTTKIRLTAIAVSLLLLGGIAVFMMGDTSSPTNLFSFLGGAFSSDNDPNEQSPEALTPPEDVSDYDTYTDPDYFFSFDYPSDHTVQAFVEDEGDMVLVQKGGGNQAFQIFIAPFDEDMEVPTPERILQDLPDMVIEDPKEVIIGGGKHALMFLSQDPETGKMRELWFIHAGSIYQVSTYAEHDSWLAGIMATWRFEE